MREKHAKVAKQKPTTKKAKPRAPKLAPNALAERRKSTRPPPSPQEMQWQRDTFVHTFFKKGAEFTEELLRENERLRKFGRELETDNAALRTQLASDEAIRDLFKRIDKLEREKRSLLSHITEAEAVSTRFTSRYSEMEDELATLANLYVASYQLHSTLNLRRVI